MRLPLPIYKSTNHRDITQQAVIINRLPLPQCKSTIDTERLYCKWSQPSGHSQAVTAKWSQPSGYSQVVTAKRLPLQILTNQQNTEKQNNNLRLIRLPLLIHHHGHAPNYIKTKQQYVTIDDYHYKSAI
jgi:hypothetical protein